MQCGAVGWCSSAEMVLLHMLQDVPMLDASDFDTGDEEEEEVAQYEAWRVRELQRIARDR